MNFFFCISWDAIAKCDRKFNFSGALASIEIERIFLKVFLINRPVRITSITISIK